MATPASFPDPAREDANLKNEKLRDAYEHGQDYPSARQTTTSLGQDTTDLEKGTNFKGAKSEEVTLNGDETTQEEADAERERERDPNVVDWDGPDDPENPQNWPDSKKWRIIATLAAVTLVTYVACGSLCSPSFAGF